VNKPNQEKARIIAYDYLNFINSSIRNLNRDENSRINLEKASTCLTYNNHNSISNSNSLPMLLSQNKNVYRFLNLKYEHGIFLCYDLKEKTLSKSTCKEFSEESHKNDNKFYLYLGSSKLNKYIDKNSKIVESENTLSSINEQKDSNLNNESDSSIMKTNGENSNIFVDSNNQLNDTQEKVLDKEKEENLEDISMNDEYCKIFFERYICGFYKGNIVKEGMEVSKLSNFVSIHKLMKESRKNNDTMNETLTNQSFNTTFNNNNNESDNIYIQLKLNGKIYGIAIEVSCDGELDGLMVSDEHNKFIDEKIINKYISQEFKNKCFNGNNKKELDNCLNDLKEKVSGYFLEIKINTNLESMINRIERSFFLYNDKLDYVIDKEQVSENKKNKSSKVGIIFYNTRMNDKGGELFTPKILNAIHYLNEKGLKLIVMDLSLKTEKNKNDNIQSNDYGLKLDDLYPYIYNDKINQMKKLLIKDFMYECFKKHIYSNKMLECEIMSKSEINDFLEKFKKRDAQQTK